MSLPNHDPFEREPLDSANNPSNEGVFEFDEMVSNINPRVDLLDKLHRRIGNLFIRDEAGDESFFHDVGEGAAEGKLARFTRRGANPHIMPSDYVEMPWTPRPNTPTAETVEEIMVRIPNLYGVDFSIFGEGSLTPDDVFLAVKRRGGEVHKYHANYYTPEDELIGYDNGEDIVFSSAEIENPPEHGRQPSVFSVKTPSIRVPKLSVVTARAMIFTDSNYHQLPKA